MPLNGLSGPRGQGLALTIPRDSIAPHSVALADGTDRTLTFPGVLAQSWRLACLALLSAIAV